MCGGASVSATMTVQQGLLGLSFPYAGEKATRNDQIILAHRSCYPPLASEDAAATLTDAPWREDKGLGFCQQLLPTMPAPCN